MMMAHTKDAKRKARQLFLYSDLTTEEMVYDLKIEVWRLTTQDWLETFS